eukprot:scpid35837/ scgid16299/ Chromodomain Y-like protein 2
MFSPLRPVKYEGLQQLPVAHSSHCQSHSQPETCLTRHCNHNSACTATRKSCCTNGAITAAAQSHSAHSRSLHRSNGYQIHTPVAGPGRCWCLRSSFPTRAVCAEANSSVTRAKLLDVVWAMAESGSTGPFHAVENILDTRVSGGQRMYLIRWEGYGEADDSWEPKEHLLPGAKLLVDQFHKRRQSQDKAGRPGTSPTGQRGHSGSSPRRSPGRPRKSPARQLSSPGRVKSRVKVTAFSDSEDIEDDTTDGVDMAASILHARKLAQEQLPPVVSALSGSIAERPQKSVAPALSRPMLASASLQASVPPEADVTSSYAYQLARAGSDFVDSPMDDAGGNSVRNRVAESKPSASEEPECLADLHPLVERDRTDIRLLFLSLLVVCLLVFSVLPQIVEPSRP